MPRTTRSGTTPKVNGKSSKKTKETNSAERKSRGRLNASLPSESGSTSARAVTRKRGVENPDSISSPTDNVSVLPSSKRRRCPETSSSSKLTSPVSPDALINSGVSVLGDTSEKVVPPTRRSTAARKRKIEPSSPENVGINISSNNPNVLKKAKLDNSPASSRTENELSPKVVMSPLKSLPKSNEGVPLPASELSPTIHLTELTSLDSSLTCTEQDSSKQGKTESISNYDTTPSFCIEKSANCTKKPNSPSKTIDSAISINDDIPENRAVLVENISSPPLNVPRISRSPSKKVATLPKLTKRELIASQRRLLLQHLDHYDLSDLTSTTNLLAGWPKIDFKPSIELTSTADTTKSSQRIWISREDLRVNVNLQTVNEAPGIQATKKIIVDDTPVSEDVNFTDSFCIASFTLPTSKKNCPDTSSQITEHEKILQEIDVIIPDVFCVRNADLEYSANRLRPELGRRGFLCSAFPIEIALVQPCFIFYNKNVFTEIAFHHLAVQAVARRLATLSAYPQSWRDALCQSFSSSLFMSSTSADNAGPELLVSVLRHIKSGAMILVACLTDKPSPPNFDDLTGINNPPELSSVPPSARTSTLLKPSEEMCSSKEPASPLPQHPIISSANRFGMDWNRIPYVTCPAGALTTTVSMARPGCSISCSTEWCPPSFSSRPDLAAVNAAGALLAIEDIWNEIFESHSGHNPNYRFQNGFENGTLDENLDASPNNHSKPLLRWVLCANLEASPSSPVYQICTSGYPSDESLDRLRTVRNIHLEGHEYVDSTTLIDLLWHAFQHPLTDVISCYKSVMGQEPPFTRFTSTSSSSLNSEARMIPRKCVDYIFCSSTTLQPQVVLVPPCRALVTLNTNVQQRPTAHPLSCGTEISLPLATRIGIKSTI